MVGAKTHPEYANIWATRADGWNYANPLTGPNGPRMYVGDRLYFQRAMASNAVAIQSVPDSRRDPKGLAVVLSRAVAGIDGRPNGTVQAAFELLPVQQLVSRVFVPVGAVIRIVDGNGCIIASSSEPEKWVGTTVNQLPYWNEIWSQETGFFEGRFIDGVRRLAGYSPSGVAGWKVIVGLPPELARASAVPRIARLLAMLAVPIAAIGALALQLSRRPKPANGTPRSGTDCCRALGKRSSFSTATGAS